MAPTIEARLGSWSPDTLDRFLGALQSIAAGGPRVVAVLDRLLADAAPYRPESELGPSFPGVLRVVLDGFDCITFVYTVLAMARASSYCDFVEELREIRYADGRVRPDALLHYPISAVRQMQSRGALVDVTAIIAGSEPLAERRVRLGIKDDGEPFLPEGAAIGDPGYGQTIAVGYLPTSALAPRECHIENGDLLLLVTRKPTAEYPGIVSHSAFAYRSAGVAHACVVHAGRSRVGSKNGPHAGVSLLREWDAERGALRPDGPPRSLTRYVESNPDHWVGLMVARVAAPVQRSR